jgi:hypothetical protein
MVNVHESFRRTGAAVSDHGSVLNGGLCFLKVEYKRCKTRASLLWVHLS